MNGLFLKLKNVMQKKIKHGGSRPGSGAPKKESTTTVSVRLKTKWAAKIKKVIAAEIKRLEGDG